MASREMGWSMTGSLRAKGFFGLSEIEKKRLDCVTRIQSRARRSFRDFFSWYGYTELSATTLKETAGGAAATVPICPAEFSSPEIVRRTTLDTLGVGFGRPYFAIHDPGSDDPCDQAFESNPPSGATILETIMPCAEGNPGSMLSQNISILELAVRRIFEDLLDTCEELLVEIGADTFCVRRALMRPFVEISFEEACSLVDRNRSDSYRINKRLSLAESEELSRYFSNLPVWIKYVPTALQHVSVLRRTDALSTFSAYLVLPRAGVSAASVMLESNAKRMRRGVMPSMIRVGSPRISSQEDTNSIDYAARRGAREHVRRASCALSLERTLRWLTEGA